MKTVLDRLEEVSLAGLTRKPLQISGDWDSGVRIRNWRGSIASAERVVSLVLFACGDEALFEKSNKFGDEGIRLLLSYEEGPSGTNLHVSLGVTGGQCAAWTKARTRDLPSIFSSRAIHTGEIVRFACIDGKPGFELALLFIAHADVRFGRAGIWHLRKRLTDGVGEALSEPLAHGPWGAILWPEGENYTLKPYRHVAWGAAA